MTPPKRTRARGALPPLPPDAAAALKAQVEGVATALAAGYELAIIQALVPPWPEDPLWDQHLIAALANLAHPAVPQLLAASFGPAADKIRRKALKKALHILKTRGVAVPPDLLPREEPELSGKKGRVAAAVVSPIFGSGDCFIVLEAPKEVLGGNFLVNQINLPGGVRQSQLLSVKPREQEKFWEQFRVQVPEWVSPPPALAVRLLEEALARNPEAEGAKRYRFLREKILQHWGRPQDLPPLEELLPPVAAAEQSRLREEGRDLVRHPWFQSWIPDEEEIKPWFARLKEAQESPLVLSEQQKKVRVDAVMDEATRELYPPESRPDLGQRLLLMAYFLELQGRRKEARLARVAGEELSAPETGALTGENPFLKGLVQFAVQLAWQEERQKKEEPKSGLLTTPTDSLIIPR